jgi:hypothetical protein
MPLQPPTPSFRDSVSVIAREEIAKALLALNTDQRTAEFEITEKVANRILTWGKSIGLVIGVIVAVAGYLGFRNLSDLASEAKTEIQGEVQKAKT